MKFQVSALKDTLERDKYEFLVSFLSQCPEDILNSMELQHFKKDHLLMYTGDPSNEVYILLKGGVNAVDENVPNIPYTFTELVPIDVIGDYELFSESDARFVTIRTVGPTICLKLSAYNYLNWLKRDNHALFMRMKMLMRVLSLETQFHRQYLFLDNETRLVLYLLDECQKKARQFPHTIKEKREGIASKIGCSIRTLNRTITSLEKENLIDRNNGKITIQKEQLHKLKLFIKDSEASMKLTLPKV